MISKGFEYVIPLFMIILIFFKMKSRNLEVIKIDIKNLLESSKTNKDSLAKLVEKFMPLIFKAAKYYTYDEELFNDAVGEGKIALIRCIERYPTDSKIPFPYYAKKFVYTYIRNFTSREISLNDNVLSINANVKGQEDITLEDTLACNVNIENDFLEKSSFLEIIDFIQNLSFIEREVIERHFFLDHKLKQIAIDLDYSYRGIRYVKSRVLKLLKERFSKNFT